ncbi:hypothetical protein H6H02_06970 [Coleofasciculus sp. FACHB-1120]|nr:hypothetical protein [Coleofasciculus sp. FACHB-1120]
MKFPKLSLPDIKNKSKKAKSNPHDMLSTGSSNRSSKVSFDIADCGGF